MEIAYIIPKLANKGPVIVVLELVKEMVKHQHQCIVYYFDQGTEVLFPCETQQIKFKDRIPFERYDIVHSHGLRPDLYISIHKPLKNRAVFITTLHNYVIQDFSYQYNKFIAYSIGNLWMLALYRHNKIVTLSKDALNYYKRWFPSSKLTVAYNTRQINQSISADSDDLKLISEFRKDSILIGINAAITARKGIDQVIKALPYLPQYKLLIIGEGKEKKVLEDLCTKLNVQKNVLFLGYRKDAYRYLPLYDIYAIPSRSEGFVLTLLEAAIYKKNIVCSNIPLFQEVVKENEASFFNLNDTNSLISAIKKATSNHFLGDNLYMKYMHNYSPECFYTKYISIYQQTISEINKV